MILRNWGSEGIYFLPDCATVNVGFPLLVKLEQTIHSQNENSVDLARDVFVLILELICSSSNARYIAVERQHSAFLDFLRKETRHRSVNYSQIRPLVTLTANAFS